MKIEAERMSTDLSCRLRDALRTQAAARLLRSLQEPEKIFSLLVNQSRDFCIYEIDRIKSEVATMGPESDFCMQYKQMIASYRLPPEVLQMQLDAIISRLHLRDEPPLRCTAEEKSAVQ